MTPDVAAVLDGDESRAVADEARAWFEANWDPEMSLGDWWAVLAESGWGFPTWPTHRYGRGARPASGPVGECRSPQQSGRWDHRPVSGRTLQVRRCWLTAARTSRIASCPASSTVRSGASCSANRARGPISRRLQTRAVRDGDQWVINGQKVWTSGAHIARYGILVARTNPELPKHQGLTYFVIDMDQPGIEIRPIREMTGRSIFNEVFLTDAVVPEENRLDEVGSGWGVALTTLANERTMLGAGSFGSSGGSMSITKPDLSGRVGDLVRESGSGEGVPSGGVGALLRGLVEQYDRSGDPLFRQEYATIYSLLEIARFTDLRVKAAVERGGRPGPEVSVGKLAASHLLRTLPRDDVPDLRRRRDALGRGRSARREDA